ncbi:hypothetical protein [Salinibacillus xinjiangensis]|nr:hypothetical protein [Salinibacillus xinjiangensis]
MGEWDAEVGADFADMAVIDSEHLLILLKFLLTAKELDVLAII